MRNPYGRQSVFLPWLLFLGPAVVLSAFNGMRMSR
jgi:hypothetical protein